MIKWTPSNHHHLYPHHHPHHHHHNNNERPESRKSRTSEELNIFRPATGKYQVGHKNRFNVWTGAAGGAEDEEERSIAVQQ